MALCCFGQQTKRAIEVRLTASVRTCHEIQPIEGNDEIPQRPIARDSKCVEHQLTCPGRIMDSSCRIPKPKSRIPSQTADTHPARNSEPIVLIHSETHRQKASVGGPCGHCRCLTH